VTKSETAAAPDRANAPRRLDWQAFSARYFPDRHRHDLEALTAYAAHRRAGTAPGTAVSERDETGALEAWEDEGGPARREPA
jgi:hypothetical protein